MRRALQRTRRDGNAMRALGGDFLSIRFPITNIRTQFLLSCAHPRLFLRRCCCCVWHQSFASLIQYTPPPPAEPHWIKYGGRTGKIKSRANRRRSCITHVFFYIPLFIYMAVVVVVWEMLPRRWKYDDIRRIKVNNRINLCFLYCIKNIYIRFSLSLRLVLSAQSVYRVSARAWR